MNRVFVDTSAWFAYVNSADPDHRRVDRTLAGHSARLLTSNFVFDEVVTLCLYRLGHAAATKVGNILLGGGFLDLIRVTPADEKAAWSLFSDRGDKTYSFTDCTSFVLMRRLGIGQAITVDADFAREGFQCLP
jgi:predicted nucleic acid-binding protein